MNRSSLSVAVINIMSQSKLERKWLIWLSCSSSQSIIENSGKEINQEQRQEPYWKSAFWFVPCGLLMLLFSMTLDHLLGCGTTYMGLPLPHQSSIEEMSHRLARGTS